MKKNLFFASVALIAAVSTAIGMYGVGSDSASPMRLANIEALSRSEIGSACGGCSTSYNGAECCTIELNGVSFTLYHPRTH